MNEVGRSLPLTDLSQEESGFRRLVRDFAHGPECGASLEILFGEDRVLGKEIGISKRAHLTAIQSRFDETVEFFRQFRR